MSRLANPKPLRSLPATAWPAVISSCLSGTRGASIIPMRPTSLMTEASNPIPPLLPGEGGVRAGQSQGERLRFLDCHTLI
jgi:hypothetical protein